MGAEVLKIAFFSTLWGSSTGGIDVCSHELIEALANNSDIEVCAFYKVRTQQLMKDSQKHGFLVVTPSSVVPEVVDPSSLGPWSELEARAAIPQLLQHRFYPDVIIINDIFGREIVPVIREYFSDAQIVTLFHSAYGRSEARKGVRDEDIVLKESFQRDLIEQTDLSLSIGSFSTSYLEYLSPNSKCKIDYILPGLPRISSRASKTDRFNAASFGRLDKKSDTIKQISVSAEAWTNARKSGHIKNLSIDDVSFYAIGSRGNEAVLGEAKQSLGDTWKAHLRELPFEEVGNFEESELKKTLGRCSFVLLNSWYENFGLTFLETCTFGVPTIISSSSGFYVDALRLLGDEAKDLILSVDTDNVSRDDLIDNIEKALISAAANYEQTFLNAAKLGEMLRKEWPSWKKVADTLIEKITRTLTISALDTQAQQIDTVETPSVVAIHPWKETLADLMEWSWSKNKAYYQNLKNHPDFRAYSSYQLTGLQKKFWSLKDELTRSGFKDVVLSGGTSSGKTTLAEILFGLARPNEFARTRILYVAPTKALAQEKARSWKGKYPSPVFGRDSYEPVIVSTGDDNASDGALVRGEFNIAATVYEKANVILSSNQELFEKINMVVIDEFHMIEDLHRGTIIESLLAKIRKEKERRLESVDEDNHLRLVVITTEGTSKSLEEYLTYTDYETLEDISPLVVTDSSRAKPVTHSALFPGKAAGVSLPIFKIRTFGTDDPFRITPNEVADITSECLAFRQSLSRVDGSAKVDRRQLRWDQYKEFIDYWFERNPTGRRLLVFMNSKYEIVEVAKFLKNKIATKTYHTGRSTPLSLEVNRDAIDKISLSLDEVETTDFVQDLKRCLLEGVFVHDADVPQSVRASYERYLATELSEDFRSEIVIATETLSYGVNLRVSDVALFNVLFPEGERIQTRRPKPILLSRCDFVNMSGRAGRLGQVAYENTANVYWYLDPEDEKSFEAVTERFYVNAPEVTSNLFHKADTRVILDFQKNHPFTKTSEKSESGSQSEDDEPSKGLLFPNAVEKFSYPFVRTVLDGLRFLGGSETTIGSLEKVGCTEEELFKEFFKKSFYFHEKCELRLDAAGEENSSARLQRSGHLEVSIGEIVRSATQPSYGLVREPKTGGFQITALGSSTIDTGTEIGTVSRLRQSVLELNRIWENRFEQPLPFEMAVLPVFFQPEVHRQYLLRLPEFNHAMEWNPVENRNDLLNRATEALISMQAVAEIDSASVRSVADDFLGWTLANQPIVSEFGRYEEAAHDSCVRLYVAFLSWISGTSLRGVIGEVQKLYSSAPSKTESSVFNFEAFADNLTWKILFLISLIRTSGERVLPPSSTFDAVRFVHRARFGCAERAIPLLFKNKNDRPPLNRVGAHDLLSKGFSTATIALGGLDEKSGLDQIMLRRTTRQVRQFIDESFQEIARQFNYLASGTGQRKSNEDNAKSYWDFARAQVSALVSSGQRNESVNLEITEDLVGKIDSTGNGGDEEAKLIIRKIENGIGLDLFTPIFDAQNPERVITTKTAEFFAVFIFSDSDRASASSSEGGQRLIFVDFPWAAGAKGGLVDGCRLSPAAFGIVLSLCARNFVLNVSGYLNAITASSNSEPIGVRELYKISEPHLRKNTFPEAIFEAWAKYIEVGEF